MQKKSTTITTQTTYSQHEESEGNQWSIYVYTAEIIKTLVEPLHVGAQILSMETFWISLVVWYTGYEASYTIDNIKTCQHYLRSEWFTKRIEFRSPDYVPGFFQFRRIVYNIQFRCPLTQLVIPILYQTFRNNNQDWMHHSIVFH